MRNIVPCIVVYAVVMVSMNYNMQTCDNITVSKYQRILKTNVGEYQASVP